MKGLTKQRLLDELKSIERKNPAQYGLLVGTLCDIPYEIAVEVTRTRSLSAAYSYAEGLQDDYNAKNKTATKTSRTAKVTSAGTVKIAEGESGIKLYPHQEDAFVELNKKIIDSGKTPFKGLLVLPTGGGKTLTAARWIAENIIDKGTKVLWLAHRHELLEQAKNTFTRTLAHKDIFANKTSINWRILSGVHDQAVRVKSTDDIIIASKDSIRSERSFGYLKDSWLKNEDELFLVIDEAHHAVARTYRKLIERLENEIGKFRLLGLTATPIRTSDNERGALAKVFPDDIVYSVDLKTLIRLGILSEPIFEEVDTNVDFSTSISDEELKSLIENSKDISELGGIADEIAKNNARNACIVNRYVDNKEKYGKTIVFAINKENAIALNTLFREKGINSDYVLSEIRDTLGNSISSKDNKDKIARFRKGGDIDVLINVNILTEGTDVPDVQSVFLTRPTMSKILMTQMMGRGLRGEKAGGTKEAYIVTFIDQWNENIVWVSPEKLFNDDFDFNDLDHETRQRIVRVIAISKLEEFAVLCDKKINPELKSQIESVDFIKRIPKGILKFNYPTERNGISTTKECEVLIYDNLENAYLQMLHDIPSLFSDEREQYEDELPEDVLYGYSDMCEETYFSNVERYPAYRIEDIDDIINYYFITGALPKYCTFPDREKFDVGVLAKHIVDNNLNRTEETEYIKEKWNSEKDEWMTFFDFKEKNFRREISLALDRLLHPEDYEVKVVTPEETFETRAFEDLTLMQIREKDPRYERWLRNKVFEKYTNSEGYYYSAQSGYRSKKRLDFEIDHIIPISRGGKTNLNNLQLLTRAENKLKGDKM